VTWGFFLFFENIGGLERGVCFNGGVRSLVRDFWGCFFGGFCFLGGRAVGVGGVVVVVGGVFAVSFSEWGGGVFLALVFC